MVILVWSKLFLAYMTAKRRAERLNPGEHIHCYVTYTLQYYKPILVPFNKDIILGVYIPLTQWICSPGNMPTGPKTPIGVNFREIFLVQHIRPLPKHSQEIYI